MSTTTTPTFTDALNSLLTASASIIKSIADTISENASLIASVVVLGSVTVMAMSIARRIIPSIAGYFRGLL